MKAKLHNGDKKYYVEQNVERIAAAIEDFGRVRKQLILQFGEAAVPSESQLRRYLETWKRKSLVSLCQVDSPNPTQP